MRLKQMLRKSAHSAASAHLILQMAHHINNPLQGAILALYSAQSAGEMSPQVRAMIDLAERELLRMTELSASMLQQIYFPPA